MSRLRGGAPLAALLLSACSFGVVPPPRAVAPAGVMPAPKPPSPAPTGSRPVSTNPAPSRPAAATQAGNAVAAGVVVGPPLASLGLQAAQAAAALQAFRVSCSALQRRTDSSGLTMSGDWAAPCAAATTATDAGDFFARNFATVRVGSGATFATGYYEPEILGSRVPAPGYQVPIYRKPPDLIDLDLGVFAGDLAGRHVGARIAEGQVLPYYDRAAIDAGALANKGLEIAWGADPIEVFFLQVQGSGRLRLPDGSVMRIGYAGQNGRPYVGIGALMRDRGMVPPNQASMQGIMGLLRQQPDGGRALMEENGSFVFFRELTGAGPVGALGVPVTGGVSVAADPKFIPLGAPMVFVQTDRPEVSGLWVAQDTGGAIKGANRFDTFWGAGDQARLTAGGMSARGQALILIPTASAARLLAAGGGSATPQH